MWALCPGWVALLTLQTLDLKIKLPNAVLMLGQSCRRRPTIEPTLSVYYGQL